MQQIGEEEFMDESTATEVAQKWVQKAICKHVGGLQQARARTENDWSHMETSIVGRLPDGSIDVRYAGKGVIFFREVSDYPFEAELVINLIESNDSFQFISLVGTLRPVKYSGYEYNLKYGRQDLRCRDAKWESPR